MSKPVVSVLHTTFGSADAHSPVRRDIIDRLVEQSARVVVLTECARRTLDDLLQRSLSKVLVIPHGVPLRRYVAPPVRWSHLDDVPQLPCRLITPGFFRESKGIETVLLALWRLKSRGRTVSYLIAGEPQGQFAEQQRYRQEIYSLIAALDLRSQVRVTVKYLSLEEQISAIRASHVGIFGYQDPSQSSSGTVPLVMCVGRPVICTPFEYAKEKRGECIGVALADNFGAAAIADSLERFMDHPAYDELAKATHDRSRDWTWKKIGPAFLQVFKQALES